MVAPIFTVDFDKEGMRRLLALQRRFPRETYRGIGRAASTIRSKMRKVMKVGGGIEGVPKFDGLDEITEELRAQGLVKRSVPNTVGGKLSEPSAIQMFKNGKGRFQVGFVTGLEPYAKMFQTSNVRQLKRSEAILFHRAGYRGASVYDRPARPVVEPFAERMGRDLTKWAIRNTEKILEKAAAK